MIQPKDIVDLFGLKNVRMVRDELICSCPFTENHKRGDLRPSFGINTEKGVAHCLGCGWSGNLVQMAEQLLHLSHIEAMSAIYPDMTVEDAIALMGSRYEGLKKISPIEADVKSWAANRHEYWHQRGLNDQTIGKWQLGYDPIERRVTVPVYFDKMLVGWTKRAIDNVTQPKWKHSPNLPRNQILFGMDNLDGDSAILVEAPLSAIVLDQYGYKAIASFGCSLSDEQALLIRSRLNNLLIYYDPDDAGRKGTADAIKRLQNFVNLYIMPITSDDPAATPKEEIDIAMGRIIPAWSWSIGGHYGFH